MRLDRRLKICVVGMGYVGLPLAVEFGKKYETVGFDVDEERIQELLNHKDRTNEVSTAELASVDNLTFTHSTEYISTAQIYVITVPTPVDAEKIPDVSYLERASELVGMSISAGDFVVYESTVYPGATEEICVPILERASSLQINKGFFVGYSPERINPGDPLRRLVNIKKVTSGSNIYAADIVDKLYNSIIPAGTFKTESIRVAEAAKVIENTQRDLNIALMNELAMIFNKMGIDTKSVLDAAATKWNFIPFSPGLVGGHCIGVDPYYLTYKAQQIGYAPDIILAGRKINDGMPKYVAGRISELLERYDKRIIDARVLILGYTFKENCPDTRNTKVEDLLGSLKEAGASVEVYDPWVDLNRLKDTQRKNFLDSLDGACKYDVVVVAVGHEEFVSLGVESLKNLCKKPEIIFDIKGVFPLSQVSSRL